MIIENLSLSFGLQIIYDEVNLTINKNSKVGIVGPNGAGKTTLFNILTNKLEPDTGKIMFGKNTRIELLPQEIDENVFKSDLTTFEFLLSGRPIQQLEIELQELYEKLSTAEDENEQNIIYRKIDRTQEELIYWEQYEAESILLKIIDGMNITSDVLDQKMSNLSGGQKSKVAFARLLYQKPEIVLLDEPTNHLDKDSKEYIIDYLKKYNGSVYIISHDIEFLNQVTDKTLYIDKVTKKMKLYNGNYAKFKKITEETEKSMQHTLEKQEKEEDKLKALISLYTNSSGKRKRMAQSREKTLEKLQKNKIKLNKKAKKVNFKIKINQESALVPLKVHNLSFGYIKGTPLFENVTFDLFKKEKFLLVGENGIGKSTLLKLIMDYLKPDCGTIKLGVNTEIAYYAQEHELLDIEATIYDNFREQGLEEKQIRAVLGNFLFTGDDIFKRVKILSPGERSRVALAKLAISGANFLILDEPTNHLDPETQEIIASVFKDFPGTMLVVSHNPEFVDNLGIERTLVLPTGDILYYNRETVEYFEDKNNNKQ